jgi:hypothetical protein
MATGPHRPADLHVDGPGTEDRGFAALLKDFAEGGADLIKYEFRLAKTEAGGWPASWAPARRPWPPAACSPSWAC